MAHLDIARSPLRCLLPLLLLLSVRGASAAEITVNSTADVTADDGECTLREAITAANSNTASGGMVGECAQGQGSPTIDSIGFDIDGAPPHTITPASNLPAITETVSIDGGNNGGATDRVVIAGAGVREFGLTAASTTAVTIKNFVIHGFTNRQIDFLNVTGFVVEGCYLGTDPTGAAVVAGSGRGVQTAAFPGVTTGRIGGTSAAQRNVINSVSGPILLIEASSVIVQGNHIGVDAAGTARLGSVFTAVQVSNSNANIGGDVVGARNVIVGNSGVVFGGNPAGGKCTGSVQGNYIGTNAAGTAALNLGQGSGIEIQHAQNVLIAGNVVSGNGEGVLLSSSGISGAVSDSSIVRGNRIGTAADGTSALGNTRQGVRISSSNENLIGGNAGGEGNVIAFNGQEGIRVAGTLNTIFGNSIHSNGGLGIALGESGTPLPNDANDADGGNNNSQNYPVIDTAEIDGGNVVLSGTLDSLADTTFLIEFFASPVCDASGNGEGRTFLGATQVTTDDGGDASFSNVALPLTGGAAITATATLKTDPPPPVPPNVFTDTSEFSACKLAATLDIDGNGEYEPLTDGLLVLRYLFGFTGSTLSSNAIGNGATRTTPEQIAGYIASISAALDVDLNAQLAPLSDGLLVLRYLFGFTDGTLIAGAIGENAQRDTAEEVEGYLDALTP